jgi:ribosomal protein S18 acetylase RimI-like enzyme
MNIPSLRRAEPRDRAVLGELAGELVRMHHAIDPGRFLSPDGVEDGYGRWLIQEAANPDAVVLVALGDAPTDGRSDSPILGYAYARREPKNWNDLVDEHGKIHDVFVRPEGRRRGTARTLVLAACEALEALGCRRILLATAVKNESAQRLFTSLGFQPSMLEMTRAPRG